MEPYIELLSLLFVNRLGETHEGSLVATKAERFGRLKAMFFSPRGTAGTFVRALILLTNLQLWLHFVGRSRVHMNHWCKLKFKALWASF